MICEDPNISFSVLDTLVVPPFHCFFPEHWCYPMILGDLMQWYPLMKKRPWSIWAHMSQVMSLNEVDTIIISRYMFL